MTISYTANAQSRDIYTVSRLNDETREVLEQTFDVVWLEGEISNVVRPASGHMYFSLKDARCQVRAAMFRSRTRELTFQPENGTQVLVHARVSLYPDRGDFQLIVEYMEEGGEGALRRAYEVLKQKLAALGLFDEQHKKTIPIMPTRVGIITSASGAALRDVLSVMGRRFAAMPVLIYPAPVQGEGAADALARAVQRACEHQYCDVLIICRGGGSLEDLWAFNTEVLAQAIYQCEIPIISGVGHEIDFTIADLVADRRAPTPSAAAELVTPVRDELEQRLDVLDERAIRTLRNRLDKQRQLLTFLTRQLVHPRRRVRDGVQRADELRARLERAIHARTNTARSHVRLQLAALAQHHPSNRLQRARAHLKHLESTLVNGCRQFMGSRKADLVALQRAFDAMSPINTLQRGYAIVTVSDTGKILRDASYTHDGQIIEAQLAKGRVIATVTGKKPD